jgi:TPR repeat protein
LPEAIFELGQCYQHGQRGVSKSTKKAAKIYKRGVELGSVDSMINLGSIFFRGDGVKLDKKKATQLWKMAAERGNAMAQAKFSTLFVHSDPKEALRWMTLSAQQGFTEGEAILGAFLSHGPHAAETDLDEAKRWLARAAAKGNKNAIEALKNVLREHP